MDGAAPSLPPRGLDDSITAGPTLTNVNDFRAILIEATAGKNYCSIR